MSLRQLSGWLNAFKIELDRIGINIDDRRRNPLKHRRQGRQRRPIYYGGWQA